MNLKRLSYHFGFWFLIKAYELFVYKAADNNFSFALKLTLIRLPIELMITYFAIYYFIPKFRRNNRKVPLFISAFLILFISLVLYRIERYFFIPELNKGKQLIEFLLDIPNLLISVFYLLPVPAIAIIIKAFSELYKAQNEKQLIEEQKTDVQIRLLKSQINPHFLFNTLNNLYALSLKQSENTKDGILQLSKIMEYMLLDSSKQYVPLQKEIQYLKSFIELQKLRYYNQLQISWDMDEELNNVLISPFILFPFIENALKHGLNSEGDICFISIYLKKENDFLVYKVVNSKPDKIDIVDNISGQGLKNLKQQLDLIYNNKYEMKVTDMRDSFLSILKIKI